MVKKKKKHTDTALGVVLAMKKVNLDSVYSWGCQSTQATASNSNDYLCKKKCCSQIISCSGPWKFEMESYSFINHTGGQQDGLLQYSVVGDCQVNYIIIKVI